MFVAQESSRRGDYYEGMGDAGFELWRPDQAAEYLDGDLVAIWGHAFGGQCGGIWDVVSKAEG